MNVKEETSIRLLGNFDSSALAVLLRHSLMQALALKTSLPEWVVTMPGMSGKKYRYLINCLVAGIGSARYLEIGSWAGSTACSAMAGNTLTALCVDNWSLFGGPKKQFSENVQKLLTDRIKFRFIEDDFRNINYGEIGKFNVYLFDGPHEEKDQFDGIVIAQPALDDLFILLVDDFNWLAVRNGTFGAIKSLEIQVECSIEIRTTQDDTHPTLLMKENSDWHNGYFMAVCRKKM
jgi:hypothetical protein